MREKRLPSIIPHVYSYPTIQKLYLSIAFLVRKINIQDFPNLKTFSGGIKALCSFHDSMTWKYWQFFIFLDVGFS